MLWSLGAAAGQPAPAGSTWHPGHHNALQHHSSCRARGRTHQVALSSLRCTVPLMYIQCVSVHQVAHLALYVLLPVSGHQRTRSPKEQTLLCTMFSLVCSTFLDILGITLSNFEIYFLPPLTQFLYNDSDTCCYQSQQQSHLERIPKRRKEYTEDLALNLNPLIATSQWNSWGGLR